MDRLQDPIDAGRPWPVGPVAGEGPESEWGPPEVLAHVAEMLGYWLDQVELVIAGATQPVPMGRQTGDPIRIASIERGRSLSTADLLGQIHGAVARYRERLPELTADDWGRVGVHPRLGEMTVAEMLPRFVLGHMEEHAAQLRAVLGVAGSDA
jgi:DinB superfamily